MLYKTKQEAMSALKQQPLTLQAKQRHIILPAFYANALDEVCGIKQAKPVGWFIRLKSSHAA